MKKVFCLILLELVIIYGMSSAIFGRSDNYYLPGPDDTAQSNQLLYNGRIWRDLYASVHEDQFLFSYEFLPGDVTINGKTFDNLKLRYDILNDEIMTITNLGLILQLNKEMVDGFTMIYNSGTYRFSKLAGNAAGNLSGYVNVRYKDKSTLFIKQKKEISKVAAGKNYENFVEYDRTYLMRDSIPYRLRNKKDFKVFLGDKWNEVRDYMKSERIKVSKKSPDSIIPLLEFYDSLQQ